MNESKLTKNQLFHWEKWKELFEKKESEKWMSTHVSMEFYTMLKAYSIK